MKRERRPTGILLIIAQSLITPRCVILTCPNTLLKALRKHAYTLEF